MEHARSSKHQGNGGPNSQPRGSGHGNHHQHMAADFKQRFFVSLVITVPILLLSPMLKGLVGLGDFLRFTGDTYVLWALSTGLFIYGGTPFLKGFYDEMRRRTPGMMTLVALAISVAYAYSSAVVYGLDGKLFFWELATLIDIMLLGHWIEMRSVMGASRALDKLASLMPSTAHRLEPDGSTSDVALEELTAGTQVLVRPG